MNSDQNNRTNRDQEQVAQPGKPTTDQERRDIQSHRDFDEAERRKAVDYDEARGEGQKANGRQASDVPDNQEGIGP